MTETESNACNTTFLNVDVQYALDDNEGEEPPSAQLVVDWAQHAYAELERPAVDNPELTIRIVDESEIQDLNRRYRDQDKTTNVLSFEFENEFPSVAEITIGLLGDVVLCHEVIKREARDQTKPLLDHYAHMVTHGVLHLCGYDHQNDVDAEIMEALEKKILAKNNIPDPYSAIAARA